MKSEISRFARGRAATTVLLCAALALSCSGHRAFREARLAEDYGDWDLAVLKYLQLVERNPHKVDYKAGLLRSKIRASQAHFKRAREYHEAGALEQALAEYRQAIDLDPTNQYAQVEFEKLRAELAVAQRQSQPYSLEELKAKNRGSRPQPPVLDPRSQEPISLSFPKATNASNIYQALGKAFGINILFDPKLRDQQLAIELVNVTAQDALEMLMRTASHFYKVLDPHTIIVAEDNPQNRRAYEDLVIQTFFLSNAEVKDVMTMLRSLVGAKNIAANDQLNAIVLRDTADKVKVAEKIITTNDKSRGEVVIDVELLQIGTTVLRELGASLSEYRVTQSLSPNPIPASDIQFLNQANWLVNIPAFIYDFVKSSSEAQLLASPQLRISDGEQATLHIGDRVPIPVTTFNTGQTVGGNIVPVTSFQYQDVGIRLDLQPRIHHNKEVSLTLVVEVSNLRGSIEGAGGQEQPIIGTRTIESTIRLKNGETNFLAGLIRSDEIVTNTGLPGLSEIPIIGRLFSKKSTDNQRTDLVLTLTPHIVRTADITEEDLLPIWVGTEANITFRGGSPRVESEVEGPFDEDQEQGADRIREMIRRRIQNLPRGLRDAAEEEEGPEETPGVQLVPSAAPTDVFRRPPRQRPADEEEEQEEPPEARSLIYLPPVDEGPEAAAPEPRPARAASAGVDEKAGRPVKLRLVPSSKTAFVGQIVEVELTAETRKPVAHVPVRVRYDPEVLSLSEVLPGDFPAVEGEGELLWNESEPGRVILAASILGETEGVKGGGVVARLVFVAEAEGVSSVWFEQGKALTPALKSLMASKRKVKIEVVPPQGPGG